MGRLVDCLDNQVNNLKFEMAEQEKKFKQEMELKGIEVKDPKKDVKELKEQRDEQATSKGDGCEKVEGVEGDDEQKLVGKD